MNAGARPSATDVLAYLDSCRPRLLEVLRRLTEAESPSNEPGTQQLVRELIADELEPLGYVCRRIPGRSSGGMLFARPRVRPKERPAQLLLGHYDTVWPTGTLDSMPFNVEGEIVRGPGVYDMKGGIVQALLALCTLQALGLEPTVTPLVFLNSDEEIGSRESGSYVARLAQCVDRTLVLEPSLGPSGLLKTARKGIGRFTVRVVGEAAHAGLDPDKGASAILELSHVIQALFSLNDSERGISVNVGTIDGGLRPNVVAPVSTAVIDVRVQNASDAQQVEAAILGLRPATPGTDLEIEGFFGRPAMERTPANRQLWRLALQMGRELGMDIQEGMAGGGSDGNTTSLFTATLDGLGPVGDGAHAPHEYLHLGQTLERAALLTMLLMAEPLDVTPRQETTHAS